MNPPAAQPLVDSFSVPASAVQFAMFVALVWALIVLLRVILPLFKRSRKDKDIPACIECPQTEGHFEMTIKGVEAAGRAASLSGKAVEVATRNEGHLDRIAMLQNQTANTLTALTGKIEMLGVQFQRKRD